MGSGVPEVDADGGEVVVGELVLCELHEEGTFANAGPSDQDQLHKLIVVLNHTPELCTYPIRQTIAAVPNSKGIETQ